VNEDVLVFSKQAYFMCIHA